MEKYVKYFVYGTGLFIILLLAAIIPRSFFTDVQWFSVDNQPDNAEPTELVVMTQSRRVELFSLYMRSIRFPDIYPNNLGFTQTKFKPNAEDDMLIEDIYTKCLEPLMEEFLYDRGEPDVQSFGNEAIRLRSDEGGEMKIWRFFYEWQGEWENNWLEFIADIDTGLIYCFRISSGNPANQESYMDIPSRFENVEEAAYWWADFMGLDFLEMNQISDVLYNLEAIYAREHDVIYYKLGWKYYPGKMLDIAVLMEP